jgi:hypothetical protein
MAYRVELRYDGGPVLVGREDQRWDFDEGDGQDLERAAMHFESEAEVPAGWTLPQIVEDLACEGEVSYHDWERCLTVTAYKLEPAGVT